MYTQRSLVDGHLPSAAPTASNDGICSVLVLFPLCVNNVRTDSTVTTRLTDPILKDVNELS